MIGFAYFVYAVLKEDRNQITIATILIGFFSLPIMFISYELLVALTPTIGEAMSCGLLNSAGNFFAFVLIAALTPYLQKSTQALSATVMFVMGLLMVIELILICLVRIDPGKTQETELQPTKETE